MDFRPLLAAAMVAVVALGTRDGADRQTGRWVGLAGFGFLMLALATALPTVGVREPARAASTRRT